MLAEKLKQNEYTVLLTTSTGDSYIGREILRRIELLARTFSCVGVSSEDTIGIYTKNEMLGVASILACLSYGANFTILDTNDDIEDTKVKLVLSGVSKGLILSEEVLDESILTINPETFEVIAKGWNYFTLDEVEKKQISQIFDIVKDFHADVFDVDKEVSLPMYDKIIHFDYIAGIIFHDGISKGIFNASRFKHNAIIKGIEEAVRNFPAKEHKSLVNVEPFNLLYNIINGIIAPMLNGVHVQMGSGANFIEVADYIKSSKARTVYISSYALEETLTTLSKEVTTFPVIRQFLLRRLFKKMLGKNVKHFIIPGLIKNRHIINALKKKYSNLYVMIEVASFIASATYNKIPKHTWLKPRLNVSLTTGVPTKNDTLGEIVVLSDDLFHSYLYNGAKTRFFNAFIHESSPKDVEGKFKTEDIGLIRNGKLLVKGKAKHIFVNENGMVIETGKILLIANRFKIVKESTIVIKDNRLILIVEPNFDYIDKNYRDPEKVKSEFAKIKELVNKQVYRHSRIDRIIWINNPNGLYRKNYKIISNHF